MKFSRFLMGVACGVAILVAGRAAAEGFSLNPFGSKGDEQPAPTKPTRSAATTTDRPWYNPLGLQKPTLVRKMESGTKSMFASTKRALTPGSGEAEKKPAGKNWSWDQSGAQSKAKKPAGEKASLFGNWFKSKEPAKAATPQEWMSQPRVGY